MCALVTGVQTCSLPIYIRFQRAQLDRASLFSDVWQRAIWQDPELDYTLERPVGALAKKQWQDARAADRDAVMARLSERSGLFYFFAQTCGACEVKIGRASCRDRGCQYV